ncbi:ANTAR domain-containing protein [Streptomyces sp. NBC_01304]|uniref:ANTAR domain-containing protein n=1 Tax=Streptomyces sp. NBC_01304 TaxID=2903818 RepID=UPI002E132A68|nr:ANTAR domain-containing protein [Streptomyces sp. NBC_01304]
MSQLRLASAFVETADTLTTDFDPAKYLARLADRCVELLGAVAAGVVLFSEEQVSLVTSSDRDDWVLGLLEVQHLGGPCLDSFTTGAPVGPVPLDEPQTLTRWPDFTVRARVQDISSTYAVPLRLRETVLGAVIVFTTHQRPRAEVELAQALADAATIGLLHQREMSQCRELSEQLQTALTSRVLIEQAKGLLAERWGVGVDEAFRALRRHARTARRPLSMVAQAVMDGDLDDYALRGERNTPS